MRTTRNRRSRRGWDGPDDALVPIVRDRVLAAMEAHAISATELAEEIGDKQQTVSLICIGKTKRTRLARIRRMAAVFDLPAEWLTGQMKSLPGITEPWSGAFGGAVKPDTDHPAAWQLAISKWHVRIEEAYTRDQKAREKKPFEQFLRERLALTFLIHPGMWRDLLFESPDWRGLDDSAETIGEDTQVELVNFMLDALGPWLNGEVKLNYRNLLFIFGGIANDAIEHLRAEHPAWWDRLVRES